MVRPSARRASAATFLVALFGVVLLFERPAHAYIDPGSGSLIYQVLLAGLLGLGFTLRRTADSISRFVRGRFGRGTDAPEKANPDHV